MSMTRFVSVTVAAASVAIVCSGCSIFDPWANQRAADSVTFSQCGPEHPETGEVTEFEPYENGDEHRMMYAVATITNGDPGPHDYSTWVSFYVDGERVGGAGTHIRYVESGETRSEIMVGDMRGPLPAEGVECSLNRIDVERARP